MKTQYFLFFALLLLPFMGFAQETETEVKSEVEGATVYLQGARIYRKSKVNVKRGRNILVFPRLETNIDPNSIQAAAPSDIVLISVQHRANYREQPERSKRWHTVKDSLETLQHRFKKIKGDEEVLKKERDMILANQKLSGVEVPVSVAELQKASDFYRKRVGEIYDGMHKIDLERESLTKIQSRLNQEFASLGGANPRTGEQTYEIVVTLDAPLNSSIFLNLSYFVSGPRWVPRYDLRASDLSKPVDLHYRADIVQNTGIDWKNIQLTLSSGNPLQGGQKPELSPWYLNFYQPAYGYDKGRGGGGYPPAPVSMSETVVMEEAKSKPRREKKMDYADYDADNSTLADYTQVTQTAISTQFEIGLPQDVPSDGKYHRVMIREEELPATFQHFAVPKLDKDAFLVAQVTGWEGLDLLPGETNIYLEGSYIGKSFLDPNTDEDTLSFSLGRDPKVVVQREQLKDFSKNVFLGTNKQKTYAYEISIRNTKPTAIKVNLQDQIPISQNEKIIVKLEDAGGASLEEDKGFLTWELEIAPAETKKVRFIYYVKYPKKMRVTGL